MFPGAVDDGLGNSIKNIADAKAHGHGTLFGEVRDVGRELLGTVTEGGADGEHEGFGLDEVLGGFQLVGLYDGEAGSACGDNFGDAEVRIFGQKTKRKHPTISIVYKFGLVFRHTVHDGHHLLPHILVRQH